MRVLSKFIIVLVALATLSLLLFVSDKSFFQLHNISIGQIDHSAKSWMFDDIKLTIDKETQAYMGKYMWEVDLKDLMNHVLQDQRVSKVQVQRKFPNSIEVKVAAHEPVLMMITKAKGVLPIARDGNFMPALHTGLFLNVPILQGPALENDIELRKSAVKLLLSMGKTTLLNVQKISEIIYDDKQGFSLILAPDGEIVKVGNKDFKKRLGMVEKVFAYMQSKGLKGRVIDVRFSKKVVVRLRNAP